MQAFRVLRVVVGVGCVIVGALNLAPLLTALIGVSRLESQDAIAATLDFVLGALLVSAGIALFVKPPLGYRLLILTLVLILFYCCSALMTFLTLK